MLAVLLTVVKGCAPVLAAVAPGSVAARVSALKSVDFWAEGFPTRPMLQREREEGGGSTTRLWVNPAG